MQDITKLDDFKNELAFLEKGLKTNRNPKPVGQHSIDVANLLLHCGYGKNVIIAGLFHDLAEDTDVTVKDIEVVYGKYIAQLVDAMTYDIPSSDYESKYQRFVSSLDKALGIGEDALAIEAADFVANSPYYKLAQTPELKIYLKRKYIYFMGKAQPIIGTSEIWKKVKKSYAQDVKDLI